MSTTDDQGDNFRSSPESWTIDKMAYLSADEKREYIHPCAYTIKMQTHKNDTPPTNTYSKAQLKNVLYGIPLWSKN